MKVQLESTTKFVILDTPDGSMPSRLWEGHTESGIPVHAYITRIAVANDQDCAQFDAELLQCRAPSPEIAAIPARLIL